MRISSRCALVIAWVIVVPAIVGAQTQAVVSAETFEEWMSELSNWGRWGDDDQLGTVNLITPEKRVEAARLMVSGISISLARDLEKEEGLHNPSPFRHEMDFTGRKPSGGEYAMACTPLR